MSYFDDNEDYILGLDRDEDVIEPKGGNMNKILKAVKEEELKRELPKVDVKIQNTNEVRYLFGTGLAELERKVNKLVKEGYFPANQFIYDGKNYIQCMIFNGLAQDFCQSIVPKG